MKYSLGVYTGLVITALFASVLAHEPLTHIQRAAKRTGLVALGAFATVWLLSVAQEALA